MDYIITLSCPDKPGLVLAVSKWLMANSCNILDSDQFRDGSNNTFFMRVHFKGEAKLKALEHSFEPVATGNQISWQLWPCSQKPKVLIMVSKQEHCLTDLLFRAKNGELPIEIVLVASNHLEAKPIAAAQNIDFRHLPIDPDSKTTQERLLLEEPSLEDDVEAWGAWYDGVKAHRAALVELMDALGVRCLPAATKSTDWSGNSAGPARPEDCITLHGQHGGGL